MRRNGDPPTFSAIIPCYNAETYLTECIYSIVDQGFESWEIIAVDDGSTDATPQFLDSFAVMLGNRFRVIHQINQGPLMARQAAIRESTGDYLLFIDADDILRDGSLQVLSDYLKEFPDSLIQFRVSLDSAFTSSSTPDYSGIENFPHVLSIKEYRRRVCSSSTFNNLSGKVIPKSLVNDEVDYSDFSFVRNGEDLIQLIEIIDSARLVVLVNDVLYYYRTVETSLSHTFQVDFYDSVRTANSILWDSALRWNDPVCFSLLKARWLRAVRDAVLLLDRSRYSIQERIDELTRYRQDDLFIKSWEAGKRNLPIASRMLIKSLARGHYRTTIALSKGYLMLRQVHVVLNK